jgi:hypothetical protein
MVAKLISCRVMIDEIRPFLPAGWATQELDISLHVSPKQLQARLQEAIDQADGLYDPIYLGYGLCSKALVGLVARKSRLVAPKSEDCIELFLGSRQRRIDELAKEPGTFFLTEGYIGDGNSMVTADFERSVAKYGRARAEKLLQSMMAHYRRLAYIRMPRASHLEADRDYAQRMAARFQMRYDEIEGTPQWLQNLIQGRWDHDVVVAAPGQPLELADFVDIMKATNG